MKKKIIVWVIITSVLFSSAFADASVTFQCSVVRDGFKQTATAELVSIKNEPYIISSLFPQKAIQVDSAMQTLLFLEKPFRVFSTSCFQNALYRFDEILLHWLNELPTEKTSGVFTGELFETAYNKSSSYFTLDYFQQFLMGEKATYMQKKTTDSAEVSYIIILSYIIEKIRQTSGDEHLLVRSSQFDKSYLSFNIMSGHKTVMTVSVDISEHNKRKMIISFRENEKYRFIRHDILMDEKHITIHTNHYLLSQPFYNETMNHAPIYSSTMELSDEKYGMNIFAYRFFEEKKNVLFEITGEINDESVVGKVVINNDNRLTIEFSMQASDNTYEPDSGMVMIGISESDHIRLLLKDGFIPIINGILPYITDKWQNIFEKLIFD